MVRTSRAGLRVLVQRSAALVAIGVLACSLTACKGSRQERYAKVRSACRAGNIPEAQKLTEELRASDDKFNRQFQEAVGNVGASSANYCDPLLILEVEKIINRPDPGAK